MDITVLSWLRSVGWSAFTWALAGVLLVNAAAVIVFVWKRERSLVNTWTGPMIAVNIVLVAIGIGVPMVTSVARLAILTTRSMVPGMSFSME